MLEDTVLTRAERASSRRFPGRKRAIARFVLEFLSQRLRRVEPPYGTAAAGFGKPVSLKAFLADRPDADVPALGAHLMAEIERAVPVLPVPILAAALRAGAVGHEALVNKIGELRARLAALGADIDLPESDEEVLAQAEALMIRRGILKRSGAPRSRKERLLAFYAAPVEQRLGRAAESIAAAKRT